MNHAITRVAALTMLVLGCAREPARPTVYKMNELPAELSAPVASANAAIQTLQQRLVTRLSEEIGRTGPVGAVNVCRDEASAITAAVERDQGISLGRTSHRLRNPGNAPRDWTRPYVDAAAGKLAVAVDAIAVDLGDRVGVLRPIPTGAVCTTCHGSTAAMAPELQETIHAAYPEDQATGFTEGELRGFFWAEVKK